MITVARDKRSGESIVEVNFNLQPPFIWVWFYASRNAVPEETEFEAPSLLVSLPSRIRPDSFLAESSIKDDSRDDKLTS